MSSEHPYADGLRQGVLRYQRCGACGAVQTLTREVCADCAGDRLDWHTSRGRGTVHALTQVHRAPTEGWRALVPYTLVLVDLDEGARVMAHGTPDLAIGDRVDAVAWVHAGQALIRFLPTGDETT